MQQDPGNEQSECITTFDEFITLMDGITASALSDVDYYKGLLEKGQGTGSPYGRAIDKGQGYVDAAIFGVNVFNYCDLDYYLVSLGKSLGSSSGAVNQVVNLFYRFFSQEDAANYYKLSVAIIEKNTDDAGEAMGIFLALLLMTEVPDTTTTTSYQNVGQLMK